MKVTSQNLRAALALLGVALAVSTLDVTWEPTPPVACLPPARCAP